MVGSTPIQPVIVPRYTVHERALYFKSTFIDEERVINDAIAPQIFF